MHIYLSELGLNASCKLLMGREFCLPYCAYFHQKLKHSFKQKAETHMEITISKENSIKTKSGGLVGKSLSAMAEWGNSNLLTNTAWTLVSPGEPVIHISCPAASFTQSLLFSLTSLQPGPAFPPCLWVLWSLWHVCVCVCTCVLWPQGSQIPPVGDQELAQVFWSDCTVGSKLCD